MYGSNTLSFEQHFTSNTQHFTSDNIIIVAASHHTSSELSCPLSSCSFLFLFVERSLVTSSVSRSPLAIGLSNTGALATLSLLPCAISALFDAFSTFFNACGAKEAGGVRRILWVGAFGGGNQPPLMTTNTTTTRSTIHAL